MRPSLATVLCLLVGQVSEGPAPQPAPFSTFSNRTIWNPPNGTRASYPRIAELHDGTVLVTASIFPGGNDSFLRTDAALPVLESRDGGVSWECISNITDQVNGWGRWGMSARVARPPNGC